MARLPNEIMANIISHLAAGYSRRDGDGDDDSEDSGRFALAPYATVSRGWQQRVEAATFALITLTPARLASPLAAQALTPDRVRRFVCSVHVDVVLPPYDEQARGRREDEADRAVNDGAFTDVVRRAFGLLASPAAMADSDAQAVIPGGGRRGGDDGGHEVDDGARQQHQRAGVEADYRPRIRLSMSARCVSDTEDLEARKWRYRVCADRPNDIFDTRYESSYLDLRPAAGKSVQDEAEALPELHCIQEFHVEATVRAQPRYFAPRALCLVASRMPGLERVRWELCDNEKRDVALRKRLRADFARTLQALPSSLQHFYLLYDRREPLDHSFQTRSILDETGRDNDDKLSLALHTLSQRLETFFLMADVGTEFLWPSERMAPDHHQQQDSDPLWPRMRRYSINLAPSRRQASGFFERDPDASESESDSDSDFSYISSRVVPGNEREDPFRDKLDPDAARAWLLAAARGARRMPALWTTSFILNPPISCGQQLHVRYTAMANSARGGGTAELLVESHPLFTPDEEAAEVHTGAESGLAVVIREPMVW
ncbi:hypothetical protein VTK56DRAFT_2954 [Thermocarpiscus australiensis]